jgi:hypothetical protein
VLRRIERKWLKRESEAVLPGEDLLPHVRHNTLGGVIHGGVDLNCSAFGAPTHNTTPKSDLKPGQSALGRDDVPQSDESAA